MTDETNHMPDNINPPEHSSEQPPMQPAQPQESQMPQAPMAPQGDIPPTGGGVEEQPVVDPASDAASVPPVQEHMQDAAAKEVVNISDLAAGLRKVRIALGWDAPETLGGYDYDLDACVIVLNFEGRVRSDNDFIFYNNMTSEDGFIVHSGDDQTGCAPGDNEIIDVDLEQLPFDISKLVFTISIHNADERTQTFKDVVSGFIRVVNIETNEEVTRFDLAHKNTECSAIQFAELGRNNEGKWEFTALNHPHEEGLYGIARDYGVNVAEP